MCQAQRLGKRIDIPQACYHPRVRGGHQMGNMSKVVRQLSQERTRLTDELHRVTAALTAFGKVYLSGNNRKAAGNHTKHTLSAAGRKKISLAQKKRWATARKE